MNPERKNHCAGRGSIAARLLLLPLAALAFAAAALADTKEVKATLFDNVVKALRTKYYDEDFRKNELPKYVDLYRARAAAATTLEQQRDVSEALLSHVPASHLGLLSKRAHDELFRELFGRTGPTLGFELVEYDGKHYAASVLEGGPAENAGLLRGDRVITIDGKLVDDSPRLGWRTDDAFLADPPVRSVFCEDGDVVNLLVERSPGKTLAIEIESGEYSAFEAAKASARVIEHGGRRFGYLHLWMIHITGPDELIKQKLEGEFADCDGFVFDMRGRGGNGMMIPRILKVLSGKTSTWRKPIVALIDSHSRSAKDILAYEIREQGIGRLVGEPTAGAVIPASFEDVGFESTLMLPTFTLGKYTRILEGHPTPPDVYVPDAGPLSAGSDPILEAGIVEINRMAEHTPNPRDIAKARVEQDKTARPRKRSDVKMPTLDALLARMVSAAGGEKALRRHESMTLTGKLDIGGMLGGKLVVRRAAPNLFGQHIELGGMGTIERGFDGHTAWRNDARQGPAVLDGDERDRMELEADFHDTLHFKKNHKSIKLAGTENFSDRTCFVMNTVDVVGDEITYYIDADTFDIAGSRRMRDTQMGNLAEVTTFRKYGEFDGVRIATDTHMTLGTLQEQTLTIEKVSFDPQPDDAFALPEAVQELLEK